MASILLTRREAETGDLPDVCMRCGAPAMERKRRLFVSHPLWVYVLLPFGYLPYVIAASVRTQRVRCYTHFCRRHKNHWVYRALIIWGGLVALLVLIPSGFAIVAWMEHLVGKKIEGSLAGMLCSFGPEVLMFCWLTSIPVLQLTAIHPADITERRLTLKRISPAFVDAVRDYRERPEAGKAREEYWSEFRARRSETSEDVYDLERRRQSLPNREGFEEKS